jgi:hypothetical protein
MLPANPTALMILAGGGFYFETKCLLTEIGDRANFIYLRTEFGGMPGKDDIPDGKSYLVDKT